MNQSISFAPSQSQAPKGFGAGDYVPHIRRETIGFPPKVAGRSPASRSERLRPGGWLRLTDGFSGFDLLGVDLSQGGAFFGSLDLAFGGVSLGDLEIRACADLVGDWADPF